MNKLIAREYLRWMSVALFSWVYLFHILFYVCKIGDMGGVYSDITRYKNHFKLKGSRLLLLLYLLHNDRYFRNLFYHRIGPVWSLLIGWYRPGDRYFLIPSSMKLGYDAIFYHPYATVLNAEIIGNGFSCAHCTTLGFGKGGKPVIGNNVVLGASVTIIGNIHIGNNVIVGAGSVVVKDIPDNCVAAGNPAKVIKYLNKE